VQAAGSLAWTDTRVRFVALERQHAPIEQELNAAFSRVLGSSGFTLGTEVEQFEAEFAEYCEVSHCVGVASGTAALALMLSACGIGSGDEVIVPGHTFIASALAVAHAGATPVLCDVDAGTGLIDPAAARAMIGRRTAAILAVHLYGQMCAMDQLGELARSHGLLLLEDAAQAHGASYRGQRAGSLGSAAAFSFYPSKNLGALGDGGALCTNDETVAARVRRLRHLGQRAKGEHVELGYNERLDGLQAALLRVKLPHLEAWNERRQEHARAYRERLGGIVRVVDERLESPSIHHLFPIRCAHRDAVAAVLRAHGVDSGVHYSPAVHAHAAWSGTNLRYGQLPAADAWAAEELSLPMHPDLFPEEIERVVEAVSAAGPALGGGAR
jgi:dTDP-4-amino-4,6-dideoxygalactose transaminase